MTEVLDDVAPASGDGSPRRRRRIAHQRPRLVPAVGAERNIFDRRHMPGKALVMHEMDEADVRMALANPLIAIGTTFASTTRCSSCDRG